MVLVALGACGSEAEEPRGSSTSGPSVTRNIETQFPAGLPLHSYYPSRSDRMTIHNGLNLARKSCAARFGSGFEPPLLTLDKVPEVDRLQDRYLLDDRATAEAYGYHPPRPRPTTPIQDPLTGLDRRDTAVMFGREGADQGARSSEADLFSDLEKRGLPAGGCNAAAQQEFLGSVRHPVEGDDLELDRLDDQAYTAMKEDPEVKRGFAAWSACMAKQGFNYTTPSAANDDPRWWEADRPSKLETRVAVADVDCKTQTRLVQRQFEAERQQDQAIIRENAAVLHEIETLRIQRLGIAQQLIDDNG